MKTLFAAFILIITASAFSIANAQFIIGAEAGVTATTVTTEYATFKPGMVVGLAFRTNQARMVGLKSGLHYIIKGFKDTADPSIEKVNMHYLQVPITLNLLLGKRKVRAIVDAGTYLGFWLEISDPFEIQAEDRRVDIGLTLGAGIAITEAGPGTFMLTGRLLEIGFLPAFEQGIGTPLNFNAAIIVSYLFALGD